MGFGSFFWPIAAMQASNLQQNNLFPHFFTANEVYQNEQDRTNLIDEEPLYVNAKQYYRILKRRVARTRLEEVHRLSRQRKPYLHESRHKHAMRRPRGPGGRFLTAEEIAAQKAAQAESSNADRTGGDDEDTQLSPDTEPQMSPLTSPKMPATSVASSSASYDMDQPPPQSQVVNMGYHRHHAPLSQSVANAASPQSLPPQGAPLYSTQPSPHSHHKGPLSPDMSPYAVSMPHMPSHRPQHSYPTYGAYPQESIHQRPHEMIPFGGAGASP